MSVYNGAAHIGRAVESILDQDFPSFELIILDDRSVDDTVQVLARFQDPRIQLVLNKENRGLTKNLNAAIRLATGEFIARQDADDFSEPARIGKQVQYLDNHPAVAVVGCHVAVADDVGTSIGTWQFPCCDAEIKKRLLTQNSFCHGAVMMRREALMSCGFYREQFRYAQDFDLWQRVAERYALANLPEVLYEWTDTPTAITRRKFAEQLEYHTLALVFADERRRIGRDSVALLETQTPESVLKEHFPRERMRSATWKRDEIWGGIDDALRQNDYSRAVGLWSMAFGVKPRRLELRRTIATAYRHLRGKL